MEKWFEAYAKWPAQQQLAFSLAVLVAALLLLCLSFVGFARVLHYLAVYFRGWPPQESSHGMAGLGAGPEATRD